MRALIAKFQVIFSFMINAKIFILIIGKNVIITLLVNILRQESVISFNKEMCYNVMPNNLSSIKKLSYKV